MESGKDGPGWWQRWTADAITFVPRDHGIGETILGAGKLIQEGKTEEAKRLLLQASRQIDLLRANPTLKGELVSSQLGPMLAKEGYPEDLKQLICREVPAMRSYLPNKAATLSDVTS